MALLTLCGAICATIALSICRRVVHGPLLRTEVRTEVTHCSRASPASSPPIQRLKPLASVVFKGGRLYASAFNGRGGLLCHPIPTGAVFDRKVNCNLGLVFDGSCHPIHMAAQVSQWMTASVAGTELLSREPPYAGDGLPIPRNNHVH